MIMLLCFSLILIELQTNPFVLVWRSKKQAWEFKNLLQLHNIGKFTPNNLWQALGVCVFVGPKSFHLVVQQLYFLQKWTNILQGSRIAMLIFWTLPNTWGGAALFVLFFANVFFLLQLGSSWTSAGLQTDFYEFFFVFCLVPSQQWEHEKCSFLLVTQLPSGILSNLIIARICELSNVNLPVLLFRTLLVFEKFTSKAVHADSSSQHPGVLFLYYPTCGHSSLVANSLRVLHLDTVSTVV